MSKINYVTQPLTISCKQLQELIINLNHAQSNLQKAKDQLPYDASNIKIHTRLSVVRMILDGMVTDLHCFIYNMQDQLTDKG